MRHPIQIAEILFVIAGAVATESVYAILYALVFTVALTTVFRKKEEKGLRRRFGEAFEQYRRAVPAFIPNWTQLLPRN